MKKNVIVFGLIAGIIVSGFMIFSIARFYDNPDFTGGMIMGYAAMLIAFSFVFVGIKNFRDKYNDGVITFGKAFKTGFYITLIASTMYVVVWLIEYYCFIPDFMDKYSEHIMNEAKTSGASAAEISSKVAEMDKYKEMYKNPLFVILLTYAEILPLGLVITLISALILKRKPKATAVA
ncbi:MAG: DUF4199 domain-containing protein [Bacteroidia bacterium]